MRSCGRREIPESILSETRCESAGRFVDAGSQHARKHDQWVQALRSRNPGRHAIPPQDVLIPGSQVSKNIYPGDNFCRVNQSHSKWHEESANGLLDLVYAADQMKALIKAAQAGMLDRSLGSELPRGLASAELAKWGDDAIAEFGPEVSRLVQSAQEVFEQLDEDRDGVVDWADIQGHLEHSNVDLLWEKVKSVMASWF